MTDASITTTIDTSERRLPWAAAPIATILGAVGVLALVIGLVTPWASVDVGDVAGAADLRAAIDVAIEAEYGSATPNGLSLDDGMLVVVMTLGFIAAMAAHVARGRRGKALPITAVVLGVLLAFIGFGNVGDIQNTNDQLQLLLPVTISPAFGLFATIVGGVLATAGAGVAVAKAEPKQPKSVA